MSGLMTQTRDGRVGGRLRPDRRRVALRRAMPLGGVALERLEPRIVPSTLTWIAPGGGDWDTAANWSGGKVPTATDDAVISIKTGTITHSSSATDAVRDLTSNAPLTISGGKLTVGGTSNLSSNLNLAGGSLIDNAVLTTTGTFTWGTGTVSGTGKILATNATAAGGKLALAKATITPGSGGTTGLAGDTTLPLAGKVHLTGTAQDTSHYSLSAQVGSVVVGGITMTSDTVTLSNTGETLAGTAKLPLAGQVHLTGTVQDASHYSLSATEASISVGGISIANDTVTVSNTGVTFAGDATVPLAGKVHVQGTIQPTGGHYSLADQPGNLTVAGFGLTNVVVTLTDQAETIAGDANLPLVGKVHLAGSIMPGSADTLTAQLGSVAAAGVALTNDTVTLGQSGATFAGDANLPLIGKVHLTGSLQGKSTYTLTAQLGSVTIAGFGLTNDAVTFSNSGIALAADANLPLIGKVHLTGTITDASHFSLSVPLGSLKVNGFGLTNNTVTLSQAGLAVKGSAKIPLVGTVALAATIAPSGSFSFTATPAPISALGGLVHLNNIQVTLTSSSLTVTAHGDIAQIGQADFKGSISANGSYDLKATASITIAGFTIDGADLDLGTQSLGASFDLPIPVIGDIAFQGSFSAGGHWSIGATLPGPIFIGSFPLEDLHLVLSDTSLTLGARTGVQGILDAGVTGTIYYSGLFNLTVDAHALSLGGFSLANAAITLGNSDPDHVFRMHIQANAGIPYGPNLKLNGVLDGHGKFDLVGTETIGIDGLNISDAAFELNNSGLTFNGDWNYFFYTAHINGSIDAHGHVIFHGTAATGIAGFKFQQMTANVDLNPTTHVYTADFEASENVFIASVNFKAHASRTSAGWQPIVLVGTAAVGGPLAPIVNGSLSFTVATNEIGFSGKLRAIDNLVSLSVSGAVFSDGTFELDGLRFNAIHFVAQAAGELLHVAGEAADEIAKTLVSAYKLAANDVALVLNGIGLAAGDIAKTLLDVFNLSGPALTSALHYAGVAADDIARVLVSFYDDADWVAGYWMREAGVAGTAIAGAMADVFRDTDQAAAVALHYAGVAADDIAQGLATFWSDTDKVAAYWMNQAGVAAADIAGAVADVFNDTDQAAAVALHYAGVAADDIARGLVSIYHDVDWVAGYWMREAGVAGTAIAGAVADVFRDTDQAAAVALHYAGVAADDIARGLATFWSDTDKVAAYWMNQAGVAASDIANAVADVFNDTDQALATAHELRRRGGRRHRPRPGLDLPRCRLGGRVLDARGGRGGHGDRRRHGRRLPRHRPGRRGRPPLRRRGGRRHRSRPGRVLERRQLGGRLLDARGGRGGHGDRRRHGRHLRRHRQGRCPRPPLRRRGGRRHRPGAGHLLERHRSGRGLLDEPGRGRGDRHRGRPEGCLQRCRPGRRQRAPRRRRGRVGHRERGRECLRRESRYR